MNPCETHDWHGMSWMKVSLTSCIQVPSICKLPITTVSDPPPHDLNNQRNTSPQVHVSCRGFMHGILMDNDVFVDALPPPPVANQGHLYMSKYFSAMHVFQFGGCGGVERGEG